MMPVVPIASLAAARAVQVRRRPVSPELKSFEATCAQVIDLTSRLKGTKAAGVGSQYFVAVWQRYLTWQRRRATRVVLNSLDERALRDIGVERSEIDALIAGNGRTPR
jgi:uncharacterized protein YjiS (DUF1127 family)